MRQSHLEFVQRMCVGSLAEVGLLQFSHKSFPDWLESETSDMFHVERADGEQLLSDACLRVVEEQQARVQGKDDGEDGVEETDGAQKQVVVRRNVI